MAKRSTTKAAFHAEAKFSAQNKKKTLVTAEQTKHRDRLLAQLGLTAILSNTSTARIFAKATVGELDLTESIRVMRGKAQA